MRAHTLRFSLLSLIVALACALVLAPRAHAVPDQNPETAEDVLEECLMMMEELTTDVEEAIALETAATIAEIEMKRSSGVTEKKLKKTAKSGKKALSNTARSGLAELNRITGTCMIRMRRLGSDRTLNNALLAGRAAAFRAFKDATNQGADLIDAALAGEPVAAPDQGVPDDFQGTPL